MMLHLSRLRLNPRSGQVRAELRHPYEMHRTLAKAFAPPSMPEADARVALEAARVLFRVDHGGAGELAALVQSRTPPHWDGLTAAAGYLTGQPETRSYTPHFVRGQRLAFRLRANPTVKRNGKRLGLYTDDEQLAWLGRKGVAGGFQVDQVVALTEDRAQRSGHRAGTVEHLAVRFEGLLQVVDPLRFADTVAGGIGSAKGFGFGLLSIAPVRE